MRRRCSIPSGGRDKARLAVLPAKRPTIPKDNASCRHSDQARRHSKWLCSWTFPLVAHALPASLTLGMSCRFVFLATSFRGTTQLKWGFIPLSIFTRLSLNNRLHALPVNKHRLGRRSEKGRLGKECVS